LPHYFEGIYGIGGNFALFGMHLWYLLVLFVFSLLAYPLFRWLKSETGTRVLNAITRFLAMPGMVYLLAIPVMVIFSTVNPDSFLGRRDFGGWGLMTYIPFFLYGFVIVSDEGLQQRIQQWRWVSLVAAILTLCVTFAVWASGGDPAYNTPRYTLVWSLFSLVSWCWILTFLGFGMRHLTKNTPFLQYTNEAVLPFYVMHQTVILGVGYFVMNMPIPDLAKFIINAVISFTIIAVVYEFLVRRVNVLRFLFGMKPLLRATASAPQPGLAKASR
jgi:hypothetical protein